MGTKYGLQPSHREELRRKQRIRIFFEERIAELLDIFFFFLQKLPVLYDVSYAVVLGIRNFFMAHRKYLADHRNYAIMVLGLIIILIAIFS